MHSPSAASLLCCRQQAARFALWRPTQDRDELGRVDVETTAAAGRLPIGGSLMPKRFS